MISASPTNVIDSSEILSRSEISVTLRELERRARRSINSRQNLILFRLLTCFGLRVSEAQKLAVGDLVLTEVSPFIRIKNSKRGKSRKVPAYSDATALQDLREWRDIRLAQGADETSPVLCNLRQGEDRYKPLSKRSLQYRWETIVSLALPPERAEELSGSHSGRRTYASHMLQQYGLAFVQRALGHSNIATTSRYCIPVEQSCELGSAFSF